MLGFTEGSLTGLTLSFTRKGVTCGVETGLRVCESSVATVEPTQETSLLDPTRRAAHISCLSCVVPDFPDIYTSNVWHVS